MARLTLSYGAAQIVAPAMAGYIATATGSYRGALIIAGVVMGVGLLLLTALPVDESLPAKLKADDKQIA